MHPTIPSVSKHAWRILALFPILVSCGGDASGPPKPAEVLLTAGSSVLSAVGATTQITARVLDGGGRQMDGQAVTWSSANTSVVEVGPTGLATAVAAGTATITATSSPASGSIAITVDQTPSGLEVTGGASQEGEVGLPLAEPVRFRVIDANGNNVVGKTVQFTVTQGGGSAASPSAVTGGDGLASVVWTLGTAAGEAQEMTAAIGGITRQVSATASPGAPAALETASGAGQTGLAGEALAELVAVRVVDRFGNGIAGAAVSWNVTLGGGSVQPAQSVSGDDGLANTTWVLGPNAGAHEARGASVGVNTVVFQATGLPNGVIAGTIGFSSGFLSKQLTEAVETGLMFSAARKIAAPATGQLVSVEPAATLHGTGRVDTVPGMWLVRISDQALSTPARLAAFSSLNADLVQNEIGAQLAAMPVVAQQRLAVEGISPALGVARVTIRDVQDAAAALAELRRDSRVQSVEPVLLYRADTGTPAAGLSALVDERYFPRQSWHYGVIGLPRAWDITEGNASVIVAVVDDGIRFDHPSVAPNLTNDGYDFVTALTIPGCTGGSITNAGDGDGPDPDPTIPSSFSLHSSQPCYTTTNENGAHGLHVAGTIAAAAGSGGLVGVAPRVRIRPVRSLGITGSGTNYDLAQGILYAAGLPADDGNGGFVTAPSRAPIINMSFGGTTSSAVIADAVLMARQAGSLLIAAAGNSGSSSPAYPAGYPETISVSAVGPGHTLPSYSNRGTTIDIAAPGGDMSMGANAGVWSSYWAFQTNTPLLAALQGTSMAAPHVAGVAALLLSDRPGLSADQLTQILLSTAIDIGTPGKDTFYGHGVLNAYGALTDGFGLPATLHVHLIDAATGMRIATHSPGAGNPFRFSGLQDGSYNVVAGLDDRGDQVTGRPGYLWGARGGTPSPAPITINGHGTHDGSFTIGFPTEAEPNNTVQQANTLVIGSYAYGAINGANDFDVYRILVPDTRAVTIETGGWYGMCGYGFESDTVLELLAPNGSIMSMHDDIDFSRDRLCSRVTANLDAGTWYVRVRGVVTGSYTVRVW